MVDLDDNVIKEFPPCEKDNQYIDLDCDPRDTISIKDVLRSLQIDLDEEGILIPPMMIQPFVENSIKHGITNINYPGKIAEIQVTGEEYFFSMISVLMVLDKAKPVRDILCVDRNLIATKQSIRAI